MRRPGASVWAELPFARNLRDRRFQALAAALLLAVLAIVVPPLPLTRSGVAVLAVVDITGSMNVRDYPEFDRKTGDELRAEPKKIWTDIPGQPRGGP